MFNCFYNAFFFVDPTVQAFASSLDTSFIPVDDDFIQYPDKTDSQTYKNSLPYDKSVSVSSATQKSETKTIEGSYLGVQKPAFQTISLAGEGQAESVVTSQGLLSTELEQPVMDRPWFCSTYAAAGYFMCDPLTNVPKWCQYNMSDIWCPNDLGFEYDAITGKGGSSGGGGAGRSWTEPKCLGGDGSVIPCPTYGNKDTCWVVIDGVPKAQGQDGKPYLCKDFISKCVSSDGYTVSCNRSDLGAIYPSNVDGGRCFYDYGPKDVPMNFSDCLFQRALNPPSPDLVAPGSNGGGFCFGGDLSILNCLTLLPLDNEKVENGFPFPIPVPVNPFEPVIPPGSSDECSTIICQCIAAVVRALEVVNQSVLKVDASVISVVNAITAYKPAVPPVLPVPEPFNVKPITDSLNAILKAIDGISVELVKEAESNIWDFLGDTIKELNDLVQYIIDQIIYLVVPEDTDFLRENISMLQEAMSTKFEPVAMLKTQIQMSLMTEQKNFKDIEMTLPIYGRVEFLNVEFLNYAIPKIRALISGIMIIVTSVWAYRKITSDMVR